MHSATTSRRYIHLNQLHAKAWVGVRGEVVIDHSSSKSDNFPQKCALIGGGGGAAFWEHLAVETKPKTFIPCGMQDAAAAGLLY